MPLFLPVSKAVHRGEFSRKIGYPSGEVFHRSSWTSEVALVGGKLGKGRTGKALIHVLFVKCAGVTVVRFPRLLRPKACQDARIHLEGVLVQESAGSMPGEAQAITGDADNVQSHNLRASCFQISQNGEQIRT